MTTSNRALAAVPPDAGQALPESAPARLVRLDVTRPELRCMLAFVATAAGWTLHDDVSGDVTTIVDSPPAASRQNRSVLVVAATPCAASRAVEALANVEQLQGLLFSDAPDDLPAVLAAVAEGLVAVPDRVMTLARTMPALSERQREILESVVEGLSNVEIAEARCVSAASEKREIAQLFDVLRVSSRVGLASKALQLGVEAPTISVVE